MNTSAASIIFFVVSVPPIRGGKEHTELKAFELLVYYPCRTIFQPAFTARRNSG